MSYFFETPQSIFGQSGARGEATLGDIFGAAIEQMRLVDTTNAAETALTEAYERRIAEIAAATGVELDNPMVADRAYVSPWGYGASGDRGRAMDAFSQRLSELAHQFPEEANIIGVNRSFERDAMDLARQSDERLADLLDSREGWSKWIAAFGGGMAGALTDPVTQASLALGAGPSAARSMLGRILGVASREAAINAGVEATMQPVIQNWRREVGLAHGWDQALANVGLAGALGFSFGGALAGAGEGVGALARRRMDPAQRDGMATQISADQRVSPDLRAAMDGDLPAAVRALDPVREALPPTARGALSQAEIETGVVAPARADLEASIAAREWYSSIGSAQINQWLRTGRFPAEVAFANQSRSREAIEALQVAAEPIGEPVTVYRGMPASSLGRDDGFASVTTDPRIAHDHARKASDGIVIRAVLPADALAVRLDGPEGEMLLMPGTVFNEVQRTRAEMPAASGVGEVDLVDVDTIPGGRPSGLEAHAQELAAARHFDENLGLAQRAIEGDARALDDLAARDPDLAARAGREPAYPRDEDVPGPRGLDDPFDEAALNRAIEDLEIDETMLDMPVPNEDGDIVPLRALLEDAEHDMAMSRFVQLCEV